MISPHSGQTDKKEPTTISSTTAKKNSRAFTLIELLLVVVLLGVLAGVVFPRLRGSVRATGLDEAAQRLAAFIRFARAESVRRALKIQLTIHSPRATCSLALQNTESTAPEDFTTFDDPLLDQELALPQGVRIGRVRQAQQTLRAPIIVFNPDGVSEPYSIELTDQSNRVFLVEIGPWLDQVTVSRKKEPAP
ncbi:MAG: GspH/FimT family protein [Candidatus Hydrogenedentes bacterium]|nr:GspH/FimT family protein [Candidatus Hydrogenedentota bacterium]